MSFGKEVLGFGAYANRTKAYNVEQSLIFASGDGAYLTRTPPSAGNRKTWTWSAWVKRGSLASSSWSSLFGAHNDVGSGGGWTVIQFSNDALLINEWSTNFRITSRLFRDTSAWYHIVVTMDTTQGTADDRIKMYVNGVQETSFSTKNNPSQNADLGINNTIQHRLGSVNYSSNYGYFDGYMAEVNFIDGTALTASAFGETDSATGQWIPKEYDTTLGAYGTNGYYLKMASSTPGVITASNSGGSESTDGNYKVVTFNSSGTFTVTGISGGDAAVDYLVIAGGGSGGGYYQSGGGGAGGYRTSYGPSGGGCGAEAALAVTAQAYTITVGAGGAASPDGSGNETRGNQGSSSSIAAGGTTLVTTVGGGAGGGGLPRATGTYDAASEPTVGGSGGGGRFYWQMPNTGSYAGAAGTACEGYAGGASSPDAGTNNDMGGGGGGAGGVGEAGGESTALSDGGAGLASSITGSSVSRGGGGGGAGYTQYFRGEGTSGGGTGGSYPESGYPTAGTANTGGGGGAQGGYTQPSGAGGSGVVIIRYRFQ